MKLIASSVLAVLFFSTLSLFAEDAPAAWEPCGWGGGGFYYAAAFHPTQDGVLYLAGDVNGVYRSDDHGHTFRIINNGLADYGVFSLATDKASPDTLYAATPGGLCKSVDRGEHWKLLPHTAHKELRITGEKGRSIRCVAVDPQDSRIIYAGTPAGKIYKSSDGGDNWTLSYDALAGKVKPGTLRVQFGKVNEQYYGGLWFPLKAPTAGAAEFNGIGFTFKGDGTKQDKTFMTLTLSNGAIYRSKNLNEIFANTEWRDIVLKAEDFVIDPDYAAKHADAAAKMPASPPWSALERIDFACSGAMPTRASIGQFERFFFAAGTSEKPTLTTAREFATNATVQTYGNIGVGNAQTSGSIYSVAVSAKNPSLVIAASNDSGLLLSQDAGKTWTELKVPKKASNATFAPDNAATIYATFFSDGIYKSSDTGATWTALTQGIDKKFNAMEVAVSPSDPQVVYAIGSSDWNGYFFASTDGGASWKRNSTVRVDPADPTMSKDSANSTALSTVTNICVSPFNPKEVYMSANWRAAYSNDGGATLSERNRGADMSCVSDIRFSHNRAYTVAMDEGLFVTEDNAKSWRQLWPLKYDTELSGHCWRAAVHEVNGVDQIVSTFSPWTNTPKMNIAVFSTDQGKTYKIGKAGLPDYMPHANSMWGEGYMRALASDPSKPNVLYAGIDGDPEQGKIGGGIFKSDDGGAHWQQLPHQPGSRRMFYGLAVDPTESKRIFWGACGNNGGVWRSEDGGESWKNVFSKDAWIWNLMTAADGTVYAAGTNLFKSSDHGTTWTAITKFTNGRVIVGLEADPRHAETLWISTMTWDGSSNGGIYKTTNAGATWQEITGDIPYVKPMVLRFNPATAELWAGGVGLYKLKQ